MLYLLILSRFRPLTIYYNICTLYYKNLIIYIYTYRYNMAVKP